MTPLPKAIFFDWDGTLVDSFTFLETAHNTVRGTLQMEPLAPGWFVKYFGKPREFIYADIYDDQAQTAQTEFEKFVSEKGASTINPMDGAEETLKTLRKMNVYLGVVTNKKGDFVRAEIDAFGWTDYFVSVVGAGEAEEDKPSHKPLKLAVEKANLNLQPEEILYIGDTEADLLCAHNYGCKSLFIHPQPDTQDYLTSHNPIRIVRNCHEMHDFLLQNAGESLKE